MFQPSEAAQAVKHERDELEQAIQNFIRCYNHMAKPPAWSYTVEKLERKLGTNLR